MKKFWFLAAALALTGLVACGDDDDNTPDDGGTDTSDVADTTDHGTDGTPGACEFPADPAIPEMRLMTMNVESPSAMRNAILQSLINDSMAEALFIWLIQFNGVGTGSITMTTGSGQAIGDTGCTFEFLNDPVEGYPPADLDMSEDGLVFSLAGDPIPVLDVPMWQTGSAYPDAPLLVMPLRELVLDGEFSEDHNYIGAWDDTLEEWVDGGNITGKITVADAMEVVIEEGLGMTLCGLLSGDTGVAGDPSDDCSSPQATWDNQPDTEVDGEPAYAMSATFAAQPGHIE